MTKRTATITTKSCAWHATYALLLGSLGTACSSSSAATSADGGSAGQESNDGAGATGTQGASSDDGGSSTSGANPSNSGGADSGSADTGGAVHAGHPVVLGMAGTYAILAKSAISTVPTSAITGNLGVSPAAATFITGFSLTADATNVFSMSAQVTGKVYAADYAVPTPSNLTTAIGDMQTAFTDAAGRAPDVTELGAGSIGGKTLAPGVYTWSTSLLVPTSVTLSGSANDVWILQIAKNLTVSSNAKVLLSDGATAANVFWEVAGNVDVGKDAHLEGVVMSKTAIALRTGASIHGRLLAQTAVSIDGSAVVAP